MGDDSQCEAAAAADDDIVDDDDDNDDDESGRVDEGWMEKVCNECVIEMTEEGTFGAWRRLNRHH